MLKKINKLLTNNIVYIVVIFVATFSIYNSVRPLQNAKNENADLKQELKRVKTEEENKAEELQLLNSEETKEEVARETYKISKEDEILFVFPE